MNLKSKIYTYFSIPILVIIISSVVSNFGLIENQKTSKWVKHTYYVISEANYLKSLVIDLETGQRGYIITGEDRFLEPFYAARQEWDTKLSQLKITVSDNPPQVVKLAKIDSTLKTWFEMAGFPEINARKAGDFEKAKRLVVAQTGKKLIDSLRKQIFDFIEVEQVLLAKRRLKEGATNKFNLNVINLLGVFVVLMCVGFALYLSKDIINGVGQLVKGVRSISKGDYEAKINESREDELGLLAKDFNNMGQMIKKAQDNVISANRAKGQFLANMSHEIRTPMNGVLGMVQLLVDSDLSKEQLDMVETIRSSGDSLMTILNDILDLSKIESGRLSLELANFDLYKCVDEAVTLSSFLARDKGIELKSKIHSDTALWLKGDVTRVKQIIVNLLSNAIKFTEEGKVSIEVSSSKKGDAVEVKVAVKDTGIGIPVESQKKLFTAFIQADNSTTRRFGGTGLGLSICKKLACLMGGDIEFESEVGVGTTFTTTLLLSPGTEELKKEELVNSELLSAEFDHNILIVEDNETNQKLAVLMLKKLGYTSKVASNGVEALKLIAKESNSFSLVFMDMQMPEMDGVTTTREIIKRYGKSAPPVVTMTANAFEEDRIAAKESGMVDFIAKPIQIAELVRVLKRFSKSSKKSA